MIENDLEKIRRPHRHILPEPADKLRALKEDSLEKFLSIYKDYPEFGVNSYYKTWLDAASHYGSVEIARYLLDAGADIDERNYQGRTPLMNACMYGGVNLVKLLLQRGANARMHLEGNNLAYAGAMLNQNTGNEILDILFSYDLDPAIKHVNDDENTLVHGGFYAKVYQYYLVREQQHVLMSDAKALLDSGHPELPQDTRILPRKRR